MFLYLRYALTHDTMSAKFQNKYRIPTARWQSWDYSSEGLYFITINAVHHECLFGNIVNKEMHLSAYGQIVAEEWNKSFEIRTGLFCDAFVIMPNYIHAILRIEYPVEPHDCASLPGDDNNRVSIRGARDGYGVAFREPKSISSFVVVLNR
jgi:putative transposase